MSVGKDESIAYKLKQYKDGTDWRALICTFVGAHDILVSTCLSFGPPCTWFSWEGNGLKMDAIVQSTVHRGRKTMWLGITSASHSLEFY